MKEAIAKLAEKLEETISMKEQLAARRILQEKAEGRFASSAINRII
ncbi:hypothetical protein [Flavisolibacter tropicus]|nr:hypothetical protein [Flavisolibacter tropicus]